MLEIVVDTNVFIDAIFKGDKDILPIFKKERNKEIRFVFCNQTITELYKKIEDICHELKYRKIEIHKVHRNIGYILSRGRNVGELKDIGSYCEDKEDNKFIECARVGKVKYVISRDIHILQIPPAIKDRYNLDIETLDPLDFLARYDSIYALSQLETFSGNILPNGMKITSRQR